MTYVPTWAGFIYLGRGAGRLEPRMVGWAIGEQHDGRARARRAEHGAAAEEVRAASSIKRPGSQHTSVAFGERCKKMGVRPSMGTVGDAYDNAMSESFFASLECELSTGAAGKAKAQARLALFTYIEGWYNPRRRHSGLGQRSPGELRARAR